MSSVSQDWYSSYVPHSHLEIGAKLGNHVHIFKSNFTTSVNFRVIKSKAKIVKLNLNLLLIKRDDFFHAYMNNVMSYTEHSGEE